MKIIEENEDMIEAVKEEEKEDEDMEEIMERKEGETEK